MYAILFIHITRIMFIFVQNINYFEMLITTNFQYLIPITKRDYI